MRKLFLITIPGLLLTSCALESEKKKQEKPTSAPVTKTVPETPTVNAPIEAPTPPVKKANTGLEMLDPVTANELLTDKNKRTVTASELAEQKKPEIEGDGVINIDPPKLPEVKLPDEG